MVTAQQLKDLISQGETTTVQFKVRPENAYKMGVEMVAFCNTQGGLLVIGVNDGESCGNLFADRDSVEGTSFKDIAIPKLKTFLYKNISLMDAQGQLTTSQTVKTKNTSPQRKEEKY